MSIITITNRFAFFPITCALLLCIVILVQSNVIIDTESFDSLYGPNDVGVRILTSDNFTHFAIDTHRAGGRLQLIQFYNSYCGHCIAFSPEFKKFAKNIASWNALITVSVVDCARDINRDICARYDINAYPTIRMFWFAPTAADLGQSAHFPGEGVKAMRQFVVRWISENWNKSHVPLDWPQFEPLVSEDKSKLIETLRSNRRVDNAPNRAVIIVESDANSTIGREIMMDLGYYRNQISLYRMLVSEKNLLNQILHPQTLSAYRVPFLLTIDFAESVVAKFKVLPRPIMSKQSDEDALRALRDIITHEFITVTRVSPFSTTSPPLSSPIVINSVASAKYSDQVYMVDLHNAIRIALFHEVPTRARLDIEQTNALIRFLDVLYANFPFQSERMRQFVRLFAEWLRKRLTTMKRASGDLAKLDVDDMLTTMKMFDEYYHVPARKSFRGCNAGVRSYPCSLWTLFHTLTVAEYRRSILTKRWSSLHATLYAMREYVRHFFGCTDCAQHFLEDAATFEDRLTYANSSILWLWRKHNAVNARLRGSDDKIGELLASRAKRQFPTFDECPHCFRRKPLSVGADDRKNATLYRERYYDESAVFQYLLHFYAAERIVPDDKLDNMDNDDNDSQDFKIWNNQNKNKNKKKIEVDNKRNKLLLSNGENAGLRGSDLTKFGANNNRFALFTRTDYSIIFIFYIASIVLLVSLCAFFKFRRNRNIRKQFPLLP